MKKHSVLILILAVCLLFVSSCGAGQHINLDDAFTKGETLRLVPAELNGNAGQYGMPVGLSPDGKTVLLRKSGGLVVVRDGKAIPVTFNAQRGAGDVYGKEKRFTKFIGEMPSKEGFSWSTDGNYAAYCDVKMGVNNSQSLDVPVLDTVTGEVYLADTFDKSIFKENGAIVYISKVDRSGRFMYYILVGNNGNLQFCRCPAEGGEREILCQTVYDETALFDIISLSDMYEMQDGSWLLSGTDRNTRRTKATEKGDVALIRFCPSGSGWTAEVTSLGAMFPIWNYSRSDWSAASGYGVFSLINTNSVTTLNMAESEDSVDAMANDICHYVNLVRVLPGSDMKHDIWYMRKTGENDGDVEMVPADDYLWSVKVLTERVWPGEEQEAAKWVAEKAESPDNPVPKGYSYDPGLREQTQLYILAACLSPDGHYTLINAGNSKLGYHLYLVSLETMKVRLVETPEGVGGISVSFTPLHGTYLPGFSWNEDGTLLINNDDGVGAYRLETGSAQ